MGDNKPFFTSCSCWLTQLGDGEAAEITEDHNSLELERHLAAEFWPQWADSSVQNEPSQGDCTNISQQRWTVCRSIHYTLAIYQRHEKTRITSLLQLASETGQDEDSWAIQSTQLCYRTPQWFLKQLLNQMVLAPAGSGTGSLAPNPCYHSP